MLNPPAHEVFPDGVARPGKEFPRGKYDALIKVKEPVLQIVPQVVKIDGMRFRRLSAVVTKVALKVVAAVFADCHFLIWYTVYLYPKDKRIT
jgi:hypothetical protein